MSDTRKEVDALKDQLQDLHTRIQSITKEAEPEVAAEVKRYVDEASESLKGYLDQTAETVKKKWSEAKDSSKEAGKKAGEYAHENPWQVAALGLVVGVAISSILAHRSSKE